MENQMNRAVRRKIESGLKAGKYFPAFVRDKKTDLFHGEIQEKAGYGQVRHITHTLKGFELRVDAVREISKFLPGIDIADVLIDAAKGDAD